MAKELKFVMLLDCYGEMLTEHQRNLMELYYCEDLSLAEIANPMGITRQAVRDIIKRTESILLNCEEKLGFAELLRSMRRCFENIDAAADSITDCTVRNTIKNEVSNGMKLL